MNDLPGPNERCYLFAIELKLTCPIPQEQNIRGRKIRNPEEANRIFGILSANKIPVIPDFNVYDRSGEIRVSITETSENIFISERELEMVHHFHYILFSNVLALERFSLSCDPQRAATKFLVVPILRGILFQMHGVKV